MMISKRRSILKANRFLRPNLTVFCTCFLLAMISGVAASDDTEIYSGGVDPKVLFLLDVSISMADTDSGYVGSRMDRMKTALDGLLTQLDGLDVGIMTYEGHNDKIIDLLYPISDVDENREELKAVVQSLMAHGGTPTVSAMYEAAQYFKGAAPRIGLGPYVQTDASGERRYESPMTEECQSAHIVILTDGHPTQADPDIVDILEPRFGSCVAAPNPGGVCGVEYSAELASQDQLSALAGTNTITTHGIGFNVQSNWLIDVVGAGGGVYRDAASSDELVEAFNGILNMVDLSSKASAPSLAVNAYNESRHSDQVYYSFFQPFNLPRWDGNVKKYQLLNGEIVDAVGQSLINDTGGVFSESISLWAPVVAGVATADGANVADGGLAARQPVNRKWYTDAGVIPRVDGKITPYHVTNSNAIAESWLGATSSAERDTLVGWVRGFDTIDADGDGDFTDPNHYVADSLHNSPVVVSYAAKESTFILEEAVFTANNMGVVHAVDAETGDELWSYTPEELLPNVKAYIDNNSASHVYGFDGELVAYTERKVTSSYDYELEKAWLYLTQRRGGKSIFALDVSNALSATDPFEVMWKITGGVAGSDFQNLGQTWAAPQMIPVSYGCPLDCTEKNVLLFGGGYNPIYDDKALTYPVTPEATGHGNAIYMVDPETGELLWSAGNGAHHSLNLPMNDSIPTTPVPVDADSDGFVDILFVSDIAGKVWRIDIDSTPVSADELASSGGAIADLNPVGESMRFFNRVDAVISGTTVGTAYFSLVVGSGMRSSPLYDEPADNRLYVIKDPWVFMSPISDTVDPATGTYLPEYAYVVNTDDSRSIVKPDHLWEYGTAETTSSRVYGFYKNLSDIGEKILQPTLTHDNNIFVISYVPPSEDSLTASCSYGTGESRLYVLDLHDGSDGIASTYDSYATVGSGIVSNGAIVDTNDGSGLDFLVGLEPIKLVDLVDDYNTDVFRRIRRTGWSEIDDP